MSIKKPLKVADRKSPPSIKIEHLWDMVIEIVFIIWFTNFDEYKNSKVGC